MSEGRLWLPYIVKALPATQCCMRTAFIPLPWRIHSIPYGQCLRLRRNCSNNDLFREEAGKLQNRLLERGYSHYCLRKAHNRMIYQPRQQLFFKQKSKLNTNSEAMRIIMHFSNQHIQIREIIQKHWSILTDNQKVQQFISQNPLITYKRATLIKDKLV